jgi:4a-hydroxytetrahydrobiopterin dehydratase
MSTPSPEARSLAARSCVPCRGGTPPLQEPELSKLAAALPGWSVIRAHQLERHFDFPNFKTALAFANRVGAVAEEQNHHPDLTVGWGKVDVVLWTHAANGLTESDFILAAKIEQLPQEAK